MEVAEAAVRRSGIVTYGAEMRNRVLYFPYIRIPESPWLTQMLLYWDQVSSIVPYEFVVNPDRLGPYMQGLVVEELVSQVMPGAYIYDIPRFATSFEDYLSSLGPTLNDRRQRFTENRLSRIHIEKMGPIADHLCQLGLARSAQSYPWYDVEHDTAEDFMLYLATLLGQVKEVGAVPITDREYDLRRIVSAGVSADKSERQLHALRVEVLEQILPIPSHPVSAVDIRRFKDRYGEALGDFRRRVEIELVTLAGISDDYLRRRRMDIFFDEAQARIGEIQRWMHQERWQGTFGKIFGVVTAIPGATPLFGLAGAVWDAITGGRDAMPSREFAYAAHVQTEFRSRR